MIEEAILAALRVSLDDPDALIALALIEFYLAQDPGHRSPTMLNVLIDRWAQILAGVDQRDLEPLKRALREAAK